jgi:hypothetical protein
MKTKSNTKNVIAGLLTFLCFSVLFSFSAFCQDNNEAVIVIKGKIIDQNTKKPIVYGNVYVTNTSVGTVSNSEGEFILKIPKALQNKPVNFSFMGYKTISNSLADLKSADNIISLTPETVYIKEVIVRSNDPITLIKSAVRNVPANYGSSAYLCTAFYRESIMQNKQYVGIAEAVLNIYKARYTSEVEADRIKVFKGRKSQDVKKMDTLIFKLQGGTNVALLLDLAKNPESFMTESTFEDYEYQPVSITNVEGRETYVIEFNQKKDIQEPYYQGRIYLDVNTLAIKKAEFGLSPNGIQFADKYLVKKKPADTNVKTVSGMYSVDYRDVNGKWTLNHVRYEVKFKVDKKRQWFSKVYTSTVDLAITDKDTLNVAKFKYSESFKPNQIFVDHLTGSYDEDFWGSYNIIKPEEPIQEAVERISKRMKKYHNI